MNRQGVKIETFTPRKAAIWLERYNRYRHQRSIKKVVVTKLSRAMSKGTFGSATIEICQNGTGQKWLTNGQHTLSAIVDSGVTLDLPTIVYAVDTEDEVTEHFYRTDIGRRRNVGDMYRSQELDVEFEMTLTDLRKFGTAVALLMVGLGKGGISSIDIDDRLDAMRDWVAYAKMYLSLVQDATMTKQILQRRDIFATGIVTCRDAPEEATNFWSLVASGDGLERYDIREVFRRWIEKSRGKQSGVLRLTGEKAIRACALAWNSFYDGKERKHLAIYSKRGPVILKGTRFAER